MTLAEAQVTAEAQNLKHNSPGHLGSEHLGRRATSLRVFNFSDVQAH